MVWKSCEGAQGMVRLSLEMTNGKKLEENWEGVMLSEMLNEN